MRSVVVPAADKWQPATAVIAFYCPRPTSRSPNHYITLHTRTASHLSRLQLYNEDINDLLAPDNQKLAVHETKESGVYVAGLREDIVASPEQVGGWVGRWCWVGGRVGCREGVAPGVCRWQLGVLFESAG
jgi:hypothetical protein